MEPQFVRFDDVRSFVLAPGVHGRPLFDLEFYALTKDGRFGAASAYEGGKFAVADSTGARLVPMAYKFARAQRPQMPEISCRV